MPKSAPRPDRNTNPCSNPLHLAVREVRRPRPGSGRTPARLLIVEDHSLVGPMLARSFRRAGYSVTLATSVREAMLVRDRFDCAVLDIELPDGDGVDLAVRLLVEEKARSFVFHSGAVGGSGRDRARAVGTFIAKPADFRELERAVVQEIARHPHRRP